MPHDLWLMFLWALLERQSLSWAMMLPGFLLMSYWEPYEAFDLIAELLLMSIWLRHQRFWALESPPTRWIKTGSGLCALLIVQQRFSLYDKRVFIGIWLIFSSWALYQRVGRSYHSRQVPFFS